MFPGNVPPGKERCRAADADGKAAAVMRALGRRDMEWAYLTTPAAVHGDAPEGWDWIIEYAKERDDIASCGRR